ncbi:MAG: hypothetical protein GC178_15860, partial [Flavobacteriales bacterium]|nr:hypothetical protein [Flavobacteriales bacterium]
MHVAFSFQKVYLSRVGEQRSNGHTVSRLTVHLVWATKHRYGILQGDLKFRCRSILMLVCDAEDVEILRGVVSSDHV